MIVIGDKLFYAVEFLGRGPSRDWKTGYEISAVELDGIPVDDGGSSGTQSGFPRGSRGTSVNVVTVGRHTLTLKVSHWAQYGNEVDAAGKRVDRYTGTVTLRTAFEAFAPNSPSLVKQIDEPSLRPRLLKAILPSRAEFAKGLAIDLRVSTVPIGVGFHVYARIKNEEYSLGRISLRQGASNNYSLRPDGLDTPPVDADTFDLILRSDESAAKQTVDVFRIWQGELVFRDLPMNPKKK